MSTTETTLGGRYRIGPLIAQGGMGTVYRGSDDVLGRDVAIKILDDELAGNPEFIERFRREARNAALLLHQNIAGIFDYGNDDGRWYIVMELVEGDDLAARLDREVRLPWREVAGLGTQVAAALGHAHARCVVHRDVKPANIVITPAGEAKVTDFGIALAFRSTTNLTATGSVVGTPSYLAPEQAQGERAGPPADQYALGVVLFEALTGTKPFTAESNLDLALAHVSAPVPDPRDRGAELPEALADVVTTAMRKQPGARYASAEAMREALLATLRDRDADAPAGADVPAGARAAAAVEEPPAGPSAVASGEPPGSREPWMLDPAPWTEPSLAATPAGEPPDGPIGPPAPVAGSRTARRTRRTGRARVTAMLVAGTLLLFLLGVGAAYALGRASAG